ncbi:UNVERIFIED_CONTAM: hypothetical protein Slati_0698700 [Sesamum latifolium]|uniref:MOM1 alpha-helical domain-containing protein n=1 Tax=Sesamum latifolium TaxID=2727402 RepID=A0AAW2Y4K5_9LAMI
MPALRDSIMLLLCQCWIAASIAKEKVDKKDTLMLAKQLLNYQCTEEQVNSVYLKMRSLKRMYLQCPENTIGSGRDSLLAEEDISKGSSKFADEGSHLSLKMENGENCDICDDAERQILLQHEPALKDKAAASSVRMEKLKLLDYTFAKKMEEHHLLKYAQLKVREEEHLAAITEERHKAAHWLATAKACSSEPSAVNGPPLGSQSEDDIGGHQPSTLAKTTGPGNVQPMFGQHVEDRNPSERFSPEENNAAPSITSTSTPAEALGCGTPLGNLVQEDKMESLVSAEMQDLGAPAGENESTLPIQVETSELVDTVTPLPSNLEAPVTDDILTTIPSNHEAPVTENTERLHCVSVVSLICNQSPATEDNDQGIPPSDTVEPGGIEVLSHNSISQSGENLEIHGNHLDIRPVTSVARGQSVEVSATPQNDVAIPQAVVTTAEQLNQGVLPLGIDSVRFHVPSYHLDHPTHQPTSWNSAPCLLTDPLQNELERMRKETELLKKNHEDTTSQLKSDCEKEIQEMITQICKKYEVKLKESEAAFRLKRNELDKNQTKVLMNKILAEAFRSKCLDVRPPGLQGMQQGI